MKQAEKDSRRDYQDPITPDFRKHVGIWADLERLRPRGDCVVIRVIPEPEMHANLIWIPDTARGGDNTPRIGEVVAVGKGDRRFFWVCLDCIERDEESPGWRQSTFHAPEPCPMCESRRLSGDLFNPDHHPMHVKPGDWVYYWRVFANQVEVNKEIYQFVREEQHILAVLEKEPEGVSLEAVHAHDREMIQRGDWTPLEKESNGTRN